MSIVSASISIANVQSISNTIASNPNSISSLNNVGASSFTSNATSTVSSAVGDPIASVLNKILSKLANSTTLTEKKINDLTSQISSFSDKNSTVQLIKNNIVITVNQYNIQQGQLEEAKINAQISSIRNTLNILTSTINTLQTLTTTINIIKTLLSIQEALLTINPISNATFKVLKAGIKIIFLGDMMNTYSTLISNQLSKSQSQLNQFLSVFNNLQVSLNVQQNTSVGSNITPDQALVNISQDLLNSNSDNNVDNQSDVFIGSNNKGYILKVEKFGTGELIGKATDQLTGQLAIQTAPSFIRTPDDLINELKSILSA